MLEIIKLVADIVILISAVIIALTNISNFIGKPVGFFQKKQDEEFKRRFERELKNQLPRALTNEECEKIIFKEVMPVLNEIKDMNRQQNEKIEVLAKSSRDVLREKIMEIYYAGRESHQLTLHQWEKLTQYYKDYKAEDGNSYIDKYYGRMSNWEILDEDKC